MSEEEIRLLVAEGHEQGLIDDDERNMMNRVMRLGDRTAVATVQAGLKDAQRNADASYRTVLASLIELRVSG